jgi:hypothetical protein
VIPHEDLNGQVIGLLIRFGDRLDLPTQELVHDLIDHNERGVALETIADTLGSIQAPITEKERADILELAAEMSMTEGFVKRALEQCPQVS